MSASISTTHVRITLSAANYGGTTWDVDINDIEVRAESPEEAVAIVMKALQ